MNETNLIVATRIKELREISDFTVDEVVNKLSVDKDQYMRYESAEDDIPISIIYELAALYKVEFAEIITGDRPHLKTYCLVRNGKGINVERNPENDYRYQSLAANFAHKKMEPFLVTIEPHSEDYNVHYNHHLGQEFNYILEGRLNIYIDDKEILLEKGDSIFFDSTVRHTFKAVGHEPVKMVVVLA